MAFSALIERGLVSPGARLVDAKKRHKATVRADGAVSLGEAVGSIHRIGALAQGLDACNGWTFWHLQTPKGLKLIDELRAQFRSEMAEAAEPNVLQIAAADLAEHAKHPDILAPANCLDKRSPIFSASPWRSVSTIRQALIFLSPPRNFSSIDTGWPAGSTAVQISPAATPGLAPAFQPAKSARRCPAGR